MPKPTKVRYVEMVVDNSEILLAWWDALEDTPSLEGWDIKAHHMTIEYFGGKGNADSLRPYRFLPGRTSGIEVVGYAFDDKAAAVLVKGFLPSGNKHPHITVAVNGVPPSYSNELLERGPIIPAKLRLIVTGAYFDGRTGRDTYSLPWELKSVLKEGEEVSL